MKSLQLVLSDVELAIAAGGPIEKVIERIRAAVNIRDCPKCEGFGIYAEPKCLGRGKYEKCTLCNGDGKITG